MTENDPPINKRLGELASIRLYDDEKVHKELTEIRTDINKMKKQLTLIGAFIEGIARYHGTKPYYPKSFGTKK